MDLLKCSSLASTIYYSSLNGVPTDHEGRLALTYYGCALLNIENGLICYNGL